MGEKNSNEAREMKQTNRENSDATGDLFEVIEYFCDFKKYSFDGCALGGCGVTRGKSGYGNHLAGEYAKRITMINICEREVGTSSVFGMKYEDSRLFFRLTTFMLDRVDSRLR